LHQILKERLMVARLPLLSSGDDPLLKQILPTILIFVLCLGMVTAIVHATDNEGGGKYNGGSDSCNGDNRKDKSSNWSGSDNADGGSGGLKPSGDDNGGNGGKKKNRDSSIADGGDGGGGPNWNSGNWNSGKGGAWKDNTKDTGGRGNVNVGNIVEGFGHGQESSIGVTTLVVVQHTVSTHTVQTTVEVLLVTYSVETVSSVCAGWWNLVESNAERLFRKFLFLFASVGERIGRKNVLGNRKRREIYYFVVDNPFSHFRRITRMAGVGPNEGSWHLRILEKMGLIKSEYVGRYLTYHANNSGDIGGQRNQMVSLIANSNATKILDYLRGNPGVKIAHLTRALMMNRSTISYHIRRMQTTGLIEKIERNGLRVSPRVENHERGSAGLVVNPVVARDTARHGRIITINV